jgi:uncharacterized metal-binding protein YceD (DUF177 family)
MPTSPNTPPKAAHAHHNPLNVPVSSVGSGFVAILPGTSQNLIAQEPLAKSWKVVHIEHLNTDWLSPFLDESQLKGTHSPQGLLVVSHEGGVFQVRARLKFEPLLECVRCLENFRLEIESHARAVFTDRSKFSNPVQNAHRGGKYKSEEDWDADSERGLSPDELDSYEYSGLAFCLDEFLLDAMRTAIPDLPACDTECPGLCSHCGCLNTLNHPCRS